MNEDNLGISKFFYFCILHKLLVFNITWLLLANLGLQVGLFEPRVGPFEPRVGPFEPQVGLSEPQVGPSET